MYRTTHRRSRFSRLNYLRTRIYLYTSCIIRNFWSGNQTNNTQAAFRPNRTDYRFFGVDIFVSLYLNGRGKLKFYGFFLSSTDNRVRVLWWSSTISRQRVPSILQSEYKNRRSSTSTSTFEYEYEYSENGTRVVLEYEYRVRVLQHWLYPWFSFHIWVFIVHVCT